MALDSIPKPEGEETKLRFINDSRDINQQFQVNPFKLDHMQAIIISLEKACGQSKDT